MSDSMIKELENIFCNYQKSVTLLDKYVISKGYLHRFIELKGYRILNIKNDGTRLDITVKCLYPGYQSRRERMKPLTRTITFINGFRSAECSDFMYKHDFLPFNMGDKKPDYSRFESEHLPCRL